jgi:hypothetical protein
LKGVGKPDILPATLLQRSTAERPIDGTLPMPHRKRTVFFISDGTGITAETLGHSLLTQFEGINFTQVVMPFIDSVEKAEACLPRIAQAFASDAVRPIVIATLIDSAVRETLRRSDALLLDFFETFLVPLEREFEASSTRAVGRSHGATNSSDYLRRIEAINYTLAHDDGVSNRDLGDAEVILVGVSRSGKTPTCLYMALQFGIKAANYPLIPEDFERGTLPSALEPHMKKLYGLTIGAERLARIRNERRPDSKYASLENCRYEIEQAERLMHRHGIASINSTSKSIEEIATKILQDVKLERHAY